MTLTAWALATAASLAGAWLGLRLARWFSPPHPTGAPMTLTARLAAALAAFRAKAPPALPARPALPPVPALPAVTTPAALTAQRQALQARLQAAQAEVAAVKAALGEGA